MKSILSFLLISVVMLGVFSSSYAQNASGIIDSSRIIDWSQTGIPGGIPNRTIYTTINASSYGNGTNDATSGIQTALNNCPSNQVVALSAGTFRINSNITIPSNVTLRGSGAHNTILNATGSGEAVIHLGVDGGPPYGGKNSVSISSGATVGSSSIIVSSSNNISVGDYLIITELNDSSYVTMTGNEGNCTWCDEGYSGTRVRGQIVEVTTKNGTTIGITPALYSNYSRTPLASPYTASAKYAGVENLQVYANNTGYAANFMINGSSYCWIKGVESNFADGNHVTAYYAYRCEIRDSYFHDAFLHTPGTSDSDVFLAFKSSANLIENNILTRLHASIMLNWGAAGNVIAYNYMEGNYDTGAINVLLMDLSVHGAHPQFNLWEGNVCPSFHPDSTWGSSSHGTLFRGWNKGTTQICLPYSARGTSGACHAANQANRATCINYLSTYYNIVGNVTGSSEVHAQMTEVAIIRSPSNRAYDGTAYDMDFGYAGAGDTAGVSTTAYATAFLHGNYTNADGAINWANGVTHTLPSSFYRDSKPSWFGSVPWPAIGPDVTGGPGPGGHTYAIPAQVCYVNGTKTNGILNFNPDSCYGGGTSQTAQPTNLRVQ
jgi:hypothetical protein